MMMIPVMTSLVWSTFLISFSNSAPKGKVVREVKYVGCMRRSDQSLEFKLLVQNTGRLDIKSCVTKCWEERHNFAGLQKGTLCYCSISTKEMVKLSEDDCDKRCTSNCYQACGGDNALSVYCTGYKKEPVFKLDKRAVMSANIGCYDGNRAKSLCPKQLPPVITKRMTVPMCLHFCHSVHQAKFATMSGRDKCCCSNSVRGAVKAGKNWCDTPCYGDKTIGCIGRRYGRTQWASFQISRVPDFKMWPKSVFQEAIWLDPPFPEGKDFEIIKSNAAAAAADASLSGLLNKQLARKSKDGEEGPMVGADGDKVLENVVGEDKREPSEGNVKNNVAIVDVPDAKESTEPSSGESNGTIIAAIVVGFVILTVSFGYYMFSKKKKLEEASEENKEDEKDQSKRRRERRKSRRASKENKEPKEDEVQLM